MTLYLYLNAALYALFAVWCTVAATKTSHTIGYLALSSGGRSEYLVIYGGLQFGLAAIFYLCARDSAFLKLGIAIALALYVPIVLYRAVTIARFNLSATGLDIPAGPTKLKPLRTTKPGNPASSMVGMSGAYSERLAPVCAIRRKRPAEI